MTVDKAGYAWVVNVHGEVFSQAFGGGWIKQHADAIDIGLASDGAVWSLNPYGEVTKVMPLVYERIFLTNPS
jgi:hypothetical protein